MFSRSLKLVIASWGLLWLEFVFVCSSWLSMNESRIKCCRSQKENLEWSLLHSIYSLATRSWRPLSTSSNLLLHLGVHDYQICQHCYPHYPQLQHCYHIVTTLLPHCHHIATALSPLTLANVCNNERENILQTSTPKVTTAIALVGQFFSRDMV